MTYLSRNPPMSTRTKPASEADISMPYFSTYSILWL